MKSLSKYSRALLAVTALAASVASAQAGETCAAAEVMNVAAVGTTQSTTTSLIAASTVATVESTMSCSTLVRHSIWYYFQAPTTGSYRIDNCVGSNYDSVLQVYSSTAAPDPGGNTCGTLTQVSSSCNDTGSCGSTGASAITVALNAGTHYYVQVAKYGSSAVPSATDINTLSVSPVAAPPNDFCAAATVLTPSSTYGAIVSTPPQPIFAATAAAESTMTCATPKNDIWFQFTAPVTGLYNVNTCTATNVDSTLSLYTGSCSGLTPVAGGCNDTGTGICSTTSQAGVQVSLTAGETIYVQAAAATAATLTASSVLGINVSVVRAAPADQCANDAPQLALDVPFFAVNSALDAGFVPARDDARTDGGCFSGVGQTASTAPGRDTSYQFRAPEAGRYSFRLTSVSSSVNGVVYLTDSCVPVSGGASVYGPPQCIAAANRTTGTTAEDVTCVPLGANQTVFVWVDENTQSTSGSTAFVEVSRCNYEADPNDTPAQASTLACITTGSIGTAGDVDYFALGGHPTGTRVFAMAEGAAAADNDFDLRITTDTNTLEYDDSNLASAFGTNAPLIAGTVLNGLPAYLRVNHFSPTVTAEPYVLYSTIQYGAPTPELEPDNNDYDAGSASATNYFIGNITDGGLDIDYYRFAANVGDVIFMALDNVPDKTDAGAANNYALALMDPAGALILSVDDTTGAAVLGPTDGGLTATTPNNPAEGIAWRARVAGTYGARVRKTSGNQPAPYLLSISVGCSTPNPTADTFTPTTGSPSGNETVTLTGTNFTTRSVVRFGTGIATIVTVTPTELVVRTPPSAASGDVPVTVTNGPGQVATFSGDFTYDDPPGLPPVLTSLSPTFGLVSGGTSVTLNGSVFRRDAGVFFDVDGVVVPAASVTFNTAARLTAVTPPHDAGFASVTVINYDGLTSTLSSAFEFQGGPTVSLINPDAGLTTGGQTVTITGTNFRPGATVRFGPTLGTGLAIADGGQLLTVVTPSSATNTPVDVIVRNADTSSVTVANGYRYSFPAPSVTALSRTSGTTLGGTAITITGTNFFAGPTVTIGGVPATSVNRASATSITAVTPAGTAGAADVVVTNSDGQAATLLGGFRYVSPPQLSSIAPANGPVQGGTLVTLTGQDLLPGAIVRIGGVPAFAVTVTSSTTATAVTNANVPGVADVVLINPDLDAQQATLPAAFTFDPAPTITEAAPVSGTIAGGTVVTIKGTGFLSGAQVLFGSTPATAVTFTSATELRATSPARAVGVVSLTVRNPDGQLSELPRAYRFVAPPALTALSPATGDAAGGTVVTLTGSGFSATATVTFGGSPATRVSFVSATELEAEAPAHAPGAVDVVVDVDGASATLAQAFTYARNAPTLSAVAPVSGPIAGGTLLTLSGTGFAQGLAVTVGGAPATDVVVVSSVLARAVAPAHAAGAVEVVVTNDDQKSATLAGAFTYVTPPTEGSGTVADGGSGAVGEDPVIPTPNPGGVSCGCSSFDPTSLSLAGLGVLMVLSRRRRRS